MTDEAGRKDQAYRELRKADSAGLKPKDENQLGNLFRQDSALPGVSRNEQKKWLLNDFWKRVMGGSDADKLSFVNVYEGSSYEELMPKLSLVVTSRLMGTPSDCRMQAVQAVEGASRSYLRQYYTVTIAGTLRHVELRGDWSAEERIDLVVMPLLKARQYPDPGMAVVEFLAGLEAVLRNDSPRRLTEGYYKTWGMLADWGGRSGSAAGKAWAVTCYIRLLNRLLAQVAAEDADGKGRDTELLDIAATDANSVASVLDDLADDQEAVFQLANRYHLLVPLFREKPADSGFQGLSGSVSEALGFKNDLDPVERGWMIAQMMRISSAWRCLDREFFTVSEEVTKHEPDEVVDEYCDLERVRSGEIKNDLVENWEKQQDRLLAVLHLSAALFRVCLVKGDDFDEPPSSFFNLNVQLNRIKKEFAGESKKQAAALRVLAAGAGLWHALMATDESQRAFGPYNGFDCLVNLFGALTDRPELCKDSREAAKELAYGAMPHGSEADVRRLRNSLKELGLESASAVPYLGIDRFRRLITVMLTQSIAASGFQHGNVLQKKLGEATADTFRRMAPEWAQLFGSAMEQLFTTNVYRDLMLLLERVLRLMMTKRNGSFELWLTTGGPEDGASQIALLTEKGIKIPEVWRDAFLKYRDDPPLPLSDFVKEYTPRLFGG